MIAMKGISELVHRVSGLLGRAESGPRYDEELEYWKSVLTRSREKIMDREFRSRGFPAYLRECIRTLKGTRPDLRLLEVGSGPVSNLASAVDEGLIDVTAIDPLAGQYRRLLGRCDISYPIEPIEGKGEDLVGLFGEHSFDIVYSCNALDHTISPENCMTQMVRVIRDEGFVFLEGDVKEGTNEKWEGLHQHDLVPEGGQLIHYDRQGNRTDLTSAHELECVFEKVRTMRERFLDPCGQGTSFDLIDLPERFNDWLIYTMVFRKKASGAPQVRAD